MYVAIYNTLTAMGPYYADNIYKWFKTALWDAPIRIYLDVQLEQIKLERDLSREMMDDTLS